MLVCEYSNKPVELITKKYISIKYRINSTTLLLVEILTGATSRKTNIIILTSYKFLYYFQHLICKIHHSDNVAVNLELKRLY